MYETDGPSKNFSLHVKAAHPNQIKPKGIVFGRWWMICASWTDILLIAFNSFRFVCFWHERIYNSCKTLLLYMLFDLFCCWSRRDMVQFRFLVNGFGTRVKLVDKYVLVCMCFFVFISFVSKCLKFSPWILSSTNKQTKKYSKSFVRLVGFR